METPDTLHIIKASLLSPRYYFQSLIEQSQACGLLSDRDLPKLQWDLLLLLAAQSDIWSGGESSSIPTEKAQDIMASIVLVVGIQLKSYPTPELAVAALKSKSLRMLFESGMKLVRRKMLVSQLLQKRITDNLLDTPNVFYRSTIVGGINGFFKLYRPQFAAQEIHITADYPLLAGRPDCDGIEFIEQYLRCMEAENAFCILFAPQDIHHLLCGLTRDYPNIPLNIFEPVLLSALGLVMLYHAPERLDLTINDISLLHHQFSGQSEKEIMNRLEKSLIQLDRYMDLPNTSIQYVALCIPKLAVTIRNAVTLRTLDKVFLIPHKE